MIDTPGVFADLGHRADWVEVCALFEDAGRLSVDQVADILSNGGIVGAPDDRPAEGEAQYGDEVDLADDDPSRAEAAEIFAELRRRKVALGDLYPFGFEHDTVVRNAPSWREVSCYGTLVLLANIARYKPEHEVPRAQEFSFAQLFEKVVQACAEGLFRGTTVRFGVPKEPDWPTGIKDRVKRMAEDLNLVSENLEGKVQPHDGDRTLDLAARLSFGDDGPGTTIVWIQCAVGRHWDKKRHEPTPAMLEDLIQWNAIQARAIAVPWWFGMDRTYVDWFRKFNKAMILDRPRLVAGTPQAFIDQHYLGAIEEWCETQIGKLPQLT